MTFISERVSSNISMTLSNINYTTGMDDPTSEEFLNVSKPFCDEVIILGIIETYICSNIIIGYEQVELLFTFSLNLFQFSSFAI